MIRNLEVLTMVCSVVLMAAILMQQRGTSLGGAFGGETSVYKSLRGIERFLFFATVIIAIILVAIALVLLWRG